MSYSADFMRVILRVKVTDPSASSTNGYFMVDIKLVYNADEILPKAVEFEMDDGILNYTSSIFRTLFIICFVF